MIRRWSHINLSNIELKPFNKFERRHKINVFKSSVNFKRFNFKITKFKRKAMSRFKHTSNWLIYTNIIKTWALDYLFNKHFFKNQFLTNIFLHNMYIYNFNFSKIRNELFFYNFNFTFSILTKKSYLYFNKNPTSLFKNNNITFIWYNSPVILNNSIIVSYSEWDSILYASNLNKPLQFTNNFDLHDLLYSSFDVILPQIIELRKTIILLFFYNLHFKNVK